MWRGRKKINPAETKQLNFISMHMFPSLKQTIRESLVISYPVIYYKNQ